LLFDLQRNIMGRLASFLLSMLCISSTTLSQSGFVPSFPLHPNDLELTRLAQPLQYFDKIGRRAGIMAYESGTFEAWVWPWKPLRNFELSFLLGTSTQPILAKDIVRTISVTPEATVLTYTYESFTVKEIIVVPRNEPGAILLLDVYSTTPLTIVAGFLPVMQPMWPAGVGGQFSYWDDDAHAYVISEGQWRAMFLCGSPLAQQMAAPPAHMFADNPLQFKIDAKPGESGGKYIPIIIAGGSKTKVDSVKATYSRLWKNAESYYQQNHNYYQNLRNSTMQVITPNKEFNLAYEWGKVALDNLMITNPTLGTGMVAGFGLSGGGARPGFAWFFGGDAFVNSLAMNSYGDYSKVRDALAFTQKWQRQEDFPIRKKNTTDPPKDVGKMAHELSQSDGLCDWWNDYHYGYNHADTTPWYLVAMGDYVRTSGDVEFLKRSWKSLRQAYEWCLSKDSDGDGLMDLKGAGLGALEFGKLVGIYADVYTCGVWVQGIKEMWAMAELLGDTQMRKKTEMQMVKAQTAFEEKFWIPDLGFYSYGVTEKGEQVREITPWSGISMMFEPRGADRPAKCLETLNSADLCTDWGVRSLARPSPLFEPTNYNYGAVWPFIASFFNTAQFKHGFSLGAFQILEANINHATDNASGSVSEVFSGETNTKLGEAYHHQGFSTTGYMLPFQRGLIGVEVNALTKSILVNPKLPADWDTVQIRHVAVRNKVYDLVIVQSETSQSVSVNAVDETPIEIIFAPVLPAGAQQTAVWLNSKRFSFTGTSIHKMKRGDMLAATFTAVPAVLSPHNASNIGDMNKGSRIISQHSDGKQIRLTVEGIVGNVYHLKILRPQLVGSVAGGSLQGDQLAIPFDAAGGGNTFSRKDIIITTK
jgi:glycogen debranching enzyme